MTDVERQTLHRIRQKAASAQVKLARHWADKAAISLRDLGEAMRSPNLPDTAEMLEVRKALWRLENELRQVPGLLSERYAAALMEWQQEGRKLRAAERRSRRKMGKLGENEKTRQK